MADVARVDVAGRKLDLADGGSLPYDYTIVAPGLKSLDDALEIRRRLLTAFRNRASVFVQWAAAYVTRQRSVRLMTGRRP